MNATQDRHRAFMVTYAKVHEGFLRYCSALAFERVDVEDLVQDCLLSAYQNFEKLEDPAKLQHYLVRAARNRKVSLFRSAKRKAALTQVREDRLTANGATAEQLADAQILYRAIHRLPAKQRDAILLYEISGYPQREIAATLETSEAGVKMLLQRGRKKLRGFLSDPNANLATLLQTAKSIAL